MSSCLQSAETHLGAVRKLTRPWLPREALPPSGQHFRLSAVDLRIGSAISPQLAVYNSSLSLQRRRSSMCQRTRSTSRFSPAHSGYTLPPTCFGRDNHRAGISGKAASEDPVKDALLEHLLSLSSRETKSKTARKGVGVGNQAADFFSEALQNIPEVSQRVSKQKSERLRSERRQGNGIRDREIEEARRLPREEPDTRVQEFSSNGSDYGHWGGDMESLLNSKTTDSLSEVYGLPFTGPDGPMYKTRPAAYREERLTLSGPRPSETSHDAATEVLSTTKQHRSAILWKTHRLNAHWRDDNSKYDLYSNGKWKPGTSGYLANQVWRCFVNERKTGVPVSESASRLAMSTPTTSSFPARATDVEVVKRHWLALRPQQRILTFKETALHCLTTSVDKTLTFLEATHESLPYVPWMFTFTLSSLRWWRWEELKADTVRCQRFKTLVRWAIEKMIQTPDHVLSWRFISLCLEHANPEQGKQVFDLLSGMQEEGSKRMTPTMGLRFMNFFTKTNAVPHALRAFKEAARDEKLLSSDYMLRSCTALLSLDYVERTEFSQNFRILPELLGAGLEPNLIIHNVTISNSFRWGLSKVGLDVFEYIKREKLPTDSYTYLALLQDAVKTGDLQRLSEVLEDISSRPELANGIHIIGHTLHAMRILYSKHNKKIPIMTSNAFDQMLAFYSKHLRVSPLQHLLKLPIPVEPTDDQERQTPSPLILQMMTSTYILDAASPAGVIQLWFRFRELVSQHDPALIPLCATDHIYTSFLMSFARSHGTMTYLIDVLSLFLQDHPSWHCKPSVRTFITAAIGFLKWGKRKKAKQVLLLMQMKGLGLADFKSFKKIIVLPYDRRFAEAMDILERLEAEHILQRGNFDRDREFDLKSWADATQPAGNVEEAWWENDTTQAASGS